LTEDELALLDLLQKENLDKVSRERLKQASRELVSAIKAQLADLDRFWKKGADQGRNRSFHPGSGVCELTNAALHGRREGSDGKERLRAYLAASGERLVRIGGLYVNRRLWCSSSKPLKIVGLLTS